MVQKKTQTDPRTTLMALYTVRNSAFIPVIWHEEGERIHTDTHPFCTDQTCPCHEDPILLTEAGLYIQVHSLTPEQAIRYVKGQII